MKLKLFLIAFVNLVFITFPYNIIGCGPEADPYDYYSSFFLNSVSDVKGYTPFYYTGYSFLYDENEPADLGAIISDEWASYCGNGVTASDANNFVNKFARKDVNSLYFNIEKNQPLSIPDSVKRNNMTAYFLKSKNLEALGYILYAKQVEPLVGGTAEAWEPIKRDSVKMVKLGKNGEQLYKAATTDLFRLKYAYQVMRLAEYSNRYNDALTFYDGYVQNNPTQSVLQPLCLSLKAGALYHTGKKKEAAYLFSKVFAATIAKRVSNYISFNWSVDHTISRNEYLALCKTPKEKASMLALFSLGSPDNELNVLKEIYSIDPSAPELEILSIREINKLEEKYLTPTLAKEKGGKTFFYYWNDSDQDSVYNDAKKEIKQLTNFLHNAAENKNVKEPGLFEIGAAYTAFMSKDYSDARKYLTAASNMDMSLKLKDQWQLTNILVTINEKQKIDAAFEEELLPSLKWLDGKSKNDKDWQKFYRNLLSEILAQRYHQQGDIYKETLMVGAADRTYGAENMLEYGLDFLRHNVDATQTEKLFTYIDQNGKSSYQQFLIDHNSITKADVIDFAGTAYLREYDFNTAITWFKKAGQKAKAIKKNPFIDLLYDREEILLKEKNANTSKQAFATEMIRLTQQAETDKANAAKYYYQLALGYYNITYYGHAWELVQYDRSGADGYFIPKDATAFQKEYYGCFTAEKYFEKAMNATTDKELKARSLFMMAKCSQKQVHLPQYDEYGSNYDKYDDAQKLYFPKFKNNRYFPQLVKDYNTTQFYKQAFSSCSYLRDFVRKK